MQGFGCLSKPVLCWSRLLRGLGGKKKWLKKTPSPKHCDLLTTRPFLYELSASLCLVEYSWQYTFGDLAKKDAALRALPTSGQSPKLIRRALVSTSGFLWPRALSVGLVGLCWGIEMAAVRSGCTIGSVSVCTSMCIWVHAGFCTATCLTLCCVICGLVSVFLTTFGSFPLSSYKCSQSVGLPALQCCALQSGRAGISFWIWGTLGRNWHFFSPFSFELLGHDTCFC